MFLLVVAFLFACGSVGVLLSVVAIEVVDRIGLKNVLFGLKLTAITFVAMAEMLLFFPFSLFGVLPFTGLVGDLLKLDMRR